MADPDSAVTTQGMTIACPAGWRDASMLILAADQPGRSGVTPTLVVTREKILDDYPADLVERLQTFVERQTETMRASLSGFEELDRRSASEDRMMAELRIAWLSNDMPVIQSIVYACADDGSIMISTASAGRNDFPDFEPSFRSMLQSFRTA